MTTEKMYTEQFQSILFKRALSVYIKNTLFLLLEPKCVFYGINENGASKCKMSKTMESL